MLKKIFALLLSGVVFCSSALAAEKVIDENFSGSPNIASGYGIKLSGGTAESGEVTDAAGKTHALILNDSDSGGGIALFKSFEKTYGVVSAEVKFRFSGAMGNFSVSIGQGNTTLGEIYVGITGMAGVTDGAENRVFTDTAAKLNTWCTMRFCVYPESRTFDARFNGQTYKGLKYRSDYSMDGIDYIMFKTGNGKPDIVIDYYLIEKGEDLNAGVRGIEPEYTDPPVNHAIAGIINVCYNGQYKYFDYRPVNINSRVLLPFRRAFEMLGLEISYEEDTATAIGKNDAFEIRVTKGSNVAYVNGKAEELDVAPAVIENSFYIPIRFVSQSLGKSVDWEDETKTVIIND